MVLNAVAHGVFPLQLEVHLRTEQPLLELPFRVTCTECATNTTIDSQTGVGSDISYCFSIDNRTI